MIVLILLNQEKNAVREQTSLQNLFTVSDIFLYSYDSCNYTDSIVLVSIPSSKFTFCSYILSLHYI